MPNLTLARGQQQRGIHPGPHSWYDPARKLNSDGTGNEYIMQRMMKEITSIRPRNKDTFLLSPTLAGCDNFPNQKGGLMATYKEYIDDHGNLHVLYTGNELWRGLRRLWPRRRR